MSSKLAVRSALPQRSFANQNVVPKRAIFQRRQELAAFPVRAVIFVVFPQTADLHIRGYSSDETFAIPCIFH